MTAYAMSFTAVAATAVAKDVFYVQASTLARFRVRALYITKTTIGTTESVTIDVYRGSTLASTGATAIAPVLVDARHGTTATFNGVTNSTALGSATALSKLIYSSALNDYHPIEWVSMFDDDRIDPVPVIGLGERLHVRMSASAAALSISGTLVVDETGKGI